MEVLHWARFLPSGMVGRLPKNTVHGGTLAIPVLLVCSKSVASHLVVLHCIYGWIISCVHVVFRYVVVCQLVMFFLFAFVLWCCDGL